MKKFLKFTFPTLIITVIFIVLKFIIKFFYQRNLIISDNGNFAYNGGLLLSTLYKFFNMLFLPFSYISGLVNNFAISIFGDSIVYGKNPLALFFVLFDIVLLLGYSYLLACLVLYIINKIKKSAN